MGEEIKDYAMKIISVKSKALKGHAEKLSENFNYALKQANDVKLAHKQQRDQVIYFQERMDKTILKLSTLNSFARLNMKILRE